MLHCTKRFAPFVVLVIDCGGLVCEQLRRQRRAIGVRAFMALSLRNVLGLFIEYDSFESLLAGSLAFVSARLCVVSVTDLE